MSKSRVLLVASRTLAASLLLFVGLAAADAGATNLSPQESGFIQQNMNDDERAEFMKLLMADPPADPSAMETRTNAVLLVIKAKLAARGVVYGAATAPANPFASAAPATAPTVPPTASPAATKMAADGAFLQANLTPEELSQLKTQLMLVRGDQAATQQIITTAMMRLAAKGIAPTQPAKAELVPIPSAIATAAPPKQVKPGTYSVTIAEKSFNFVNLGATKPSTWSMVATTDGFRLIAISSYGRKSYGEGTRNIEITGDAVKSSGEIAQPKIPEAQESGNATTTIKVVLPNGLLAGRTPVAGSPIDRAFGPTPDGTGYTLLPWPKPVQCNGKFDTVGFCEVTHASADGAIYGKYALRMGSKEFGMAPVRWSIVNGAWVCQALIDDVAMAGLQIEYGGSNSDLVFFNVTQADGTVFGPCVSKRAGSLTAAEGDQQYVFSPGQERSLYGGPTLKGRIVDASATMTVGLYWQAGSTDQDYPVLFTEDLWKPRPIETIKGATNAAILGSTVFVTTKAATYLLDGDVVTNLSPQKIQIESIEAKTAGGFVAKGTVAGTTGFWLVSTQAGKP